MSDHLSTIARDALAVADARPVDPDRLRAVAARLDAFAAVEPRLDPALVPATLARLARAVDPYCPLDETEARRVLAGA